MAGSWAMAAGLKRNSGCSTTSAPTAGEQSFANWAKSAKLPPMRSMIYVPSFIRGLSIIFLLGLIANIGVPGKQADSQWAPKTDQLPKLTKEETIDRYKIKIPGNFTVHTRTGDQKIISGNIWVGEKRADGVRPYLMLTIASPPKEELDKLTLQQSLSTFLAVLEKKQKNWKQNKVEEGVIGGIKFIRSYWEGTEPKSGRPLHGFNYVAIDGERVINLSSQDTDPFYKESLLLTESAVLTFKKF